MLQRAAGNAYSWWWASHIRTKQSKWLDGDLQEMEERVKNMLKLLGEEADSFGKRAEMYYKKRPEVILSVEEAYRAYRALAERYDHISGELHKANHTIATAFPDQVHYAMLEEEEDNIPKAITPVDSSKIHKQTVDGLMKKKRDGKQPVLKEKKGISKENAQEEINKLQKEILMIQTEKEFIKSSYESGIAKFWELEKKMADVQEEIIFLQEEFNASAVFEDDEARALMTATALKSCEETIFNLREKQKKSLEMERIELERIKVSRERLRVIKSEYGRVKSENSSSDLDLRDLELKSEGKKDYEIKMERMEMETICEKIKSRFKMESEVSIEVTTEKIDQLVNKVVDLELFVSSQTAQINRLNLENGQLEKHLENLETEKADLVNDSSELNEKLKQAEEELSVVQSIQKAVMKEESNVRLNFSQVVNNLSEVSDTLQSPIVNEEISIVNSFGETSGNGDNSNESDYFETNGDLLCASNGEHSIDNSKGSVCFETNGDLISSSNGENLIDNVCFETNKDLISASNGEHLLDNNTKSVRFETNEEQVLDSRTGSVHFETSGDNVIDNSIRSVHFETNEEQLLDNSTESVNFETSGDNVIDNSIHFETNEEHLLDNSTGSVHFETNGENVNDNSARSVHFETNVDNEIVDGLTVWESFDSKNDINFELENLQIGSKSPSYTGHVNQNGEDEPVLTGDNPIDNNLLVEYTSVLRDYKETKKRLAEIETKNQEHIQELSTQIKELMNVNAKKDDEILSLKQMLDSLNSLSNTKRDSISSFNETNKTAIISWHQRSRSRTFSILKDLNLDPPKETDESNDAESSTPLSLEDKFRTDLDALLEENLEFWMRFSSSIQTMQDFQSKHQQIHKDENALEIKDLRALKTELQVWLEQNALLRSELKSRLSSIQTVQEEIELAVGPTFSSYQAAKFQGEVLNMQQENNRVANELKAGLNHVRGLQAELETTLERIQERVSISESRSSGAREDHRSRNMPTKNRVPLRSFLFPSKPKKPSIFALVNPVLHHPRQVMKSSFYTKVD